MAFYDWSHQTAWGQGVWGAGAWSAGAFGPGVWALQGSTCSVAPAISGSITVGSTLTCAPGTWSATNGSPTFTYQWFRLGQRVPGAAPTMPAPTPVPITVPSASNTYVVAAADVGSVVSCVVSATDTITTASRTSNGMQL
jgi:hypothetical protein